MGSRQPPAPGARVPGLCRVRSGARAGPSPGPAPARPGHFPGPAAGSAAGKRSGQAAADGLESAPFACCPCPHAFIYMCVCAYPAAPLVSIPGVYQTFANKWKLKGSLPKLDMLSRCKKKRRSQIYI